MPECHIGTPDCRVSRSIAMPHEWCARRWARRREPGGWGAPTGGGDQASRWRAATGKGAAARWGYRALPPCRTGGHGWGRGNCGGENDGIPEAKNKMCRCQRSNGTFFEEGRRSGPDGEGEGTARETGAIDEIADGIVVPSEADLGGVRGNDSDRGVLDFGIGPAIGFSVG